MTAVDDLVAGMIREEGGFQKALRNVLENDLHMTINEFCKSTGISQSTMYKIVEEKREPNLRTARMIIRSVRILSNSFSENFIAVIASHQVLQTLEHDTEVDGQLVRLREYPVSTVEDAIIAAVRAERDGALGVVCAPIVTPTIERIITIPVSPVMPTASISTAVERLKRDL
ncbi:MAG: transcriptional regulator [Candidatus Methanomethylophilaceae archaeon]|nr:transcriptional regulator [Candidatus Methanomethylophilaceae archaeon]MDY5871997.1 transcriptional regulator [Candidatus Methanomethylophilaceae archaeon]